MQDLIERFPELTYITLLFALFVVPRGLERWGVPGAITSLGLGALVGPGFGLLQDDTAIAFLAGLGIVALFLFAGLEVDLPLIRRRASIIGSHVAMRVGALALCGFAFSRWFDLDVRASLLVALALLTPSAGFILDSLPKFGLSTDEQDWVKSMVIATELLALAVLFVVMNSFDFVEFAVALGVLTSLVLGLPWVFRGFARFAEPSPRFDFAFLVIVALTAALVTRLLHAYYLVGAFVVGLVTQRMHSEIPGRFGKEVIEPIAFFAAFFVPFYFFEAGLHLSRGVFTLDALAAGLIMLAVAIPLRVAGVVVHRRVALGESGPDSLRIATTLLPTLVFTLVLSDVLQDRFEAPAWLYGGLIVYTLVNTMIPAVFFRVPATYDQPR